MHRAICLLFALTVAPALGACCNFDKDTLEQEAATIPGILDAIAGKFERMPKRWYEMELEAVRRSGTPDALGREMLALDQLERWIFIVGSNATDPSRMADIEKWRPHFLFQWALLGTDVDGKPTTDNAPPEAIPATPGEARFKALMLKWAAERPLVNADEMLPDYFGLRLASSKTAIVDNDQLDTLKLRGVIEFLLDLLKANPAWENVDTYYALSLALAVDGKQHLAHFARLRVLELLGEGKATRLPLAQGVSDIAPLLYARQLQLGKLVEIRTLDDPQKQHCAQEYTYRRAFAKLWLAERETFITKRLDAGRLPDEPDFWQGFIPRVYTPNIPPPVAAPPVPLPAAEPETPAAPASEPQEVSSRWVTGGAAGAGAVVILMLMHFSRRKRSAHKP